MEHIGISVIVPIYNTKPYLKECVDSILKQEVEVPFEVLLVDDGATDGCAEMCDEFAAKDKRVRVFHQENQGLSAARTTGIDAARGRYYAFVDSDDVVCPGYLHTLYAACTRMTLWPTACSGGATRSSAWIRCCTTTGCAAAASAAPTPSPKPLTPWTAWPTATASMWKTVLTAR